MASKCKMQSILLGSFRKALIYDSNDPTDLKLDTAVVVLTELFGVRLELATAFALLTWFVTFVEIVPVGLLVGVKEGLDWRSLRRIGKEVAT